MLGFGELFQSSDASLPGITGTRRIDPIEPIAVCDIVVRFETDVEIWNEISADAPILMKTSLLICTYLS